jgi:transcriptional regulator with XRE-family HTH domain
MSEAVRLHHIRDVLGLSLTDVASKTGISKGHLSEFENGKVEITVPKMRALLRAYGLTWAFLDGVCEHEYVCRFCGEGANP